jgi:hypothetical protein
VGKNLGILSVTGSAGGIVLESFRHEGKMKIKAIKVIANNLKSLEQ